MKPSEIKNSKILLSPLNWGLGHVSRCIGLINELLLNENDIVIACSNAEREIFETYFDVLTFELHDGYPFNFNGKGNFALDLLLSFQNLRQRLKQELLEVSEMVEKYAPDYILSDHRYSFRSNKVESVFITHQLNLPVKWYQKSIQKWHIKLVKEFDDVWVMDYPDSRLAGDLSLSSKFVNSQYIGPYSRFMLKSELSDNNESIILIASGPNVYAQQLISEQYQQGMRIICASDLLIPQGAKKIEGSWMDFDKEIRNCDLVITRSGYSSIMDSEFLDCTFQFSPTAGQSEQEYLFRLHDRKK